MWTKYTFLAIPDAIRFMEHAKIHLMEIVDVSQNHWSRRCPVVINQERADRSTHWFNICHDDVIKWKHFPRNWPFVREIHRSPVNFPHKGQWRGALMFSLIYAWINDWVNNREAGDLRRQHGHYDVIVMYYLVNSSVAILHVMALWNGNAFRIAGPLWGGTTGHRQTLTKGQLCGAMMSPLILALTNCWTNYQVASDLRRHDAHMAARHAGTIPGRGVEQYWLNHCVETTLKQTGHNNDAIITSRRCFNIGFT